MTTNISPSFSRSGRSGASGKNIVRVGTDVSESLLCDLNDAVELFRVNTPTAARAEVLRMILEEDLNGCIASLAQSFPAAKNMGLDALERTLATLAGQSLEEYRRAVMLKHIFGRLHVIEEMVVPEPHLSNGQNRAEDGPIPVRDR